MVLCNLTIKPFSSYFPNLEGQNIRSMTCSENWSCWKAEAELNNIENIITTKFAKRSRSNLCALCVLCGEIACTPMGSRTLTLRAYPKNQWYISKRTTEDTESTEIFKHVSVFSVLSAVLTFRIGSKQCLLISVYTSNPPDRKHYWQASRHRLWFSRISPIAVEQ